mmetsp:Transcript_10486/g.20236  ORF Transcript_10486/g.20236 Transcript_10486/m.20236 type:complete len:423 (+) Transcript_10486:51-1319(+)
MASVEQKKADLSKALKELKAKLGEEDKDAWGTDSTLMRFLVARECDVDEAYKMYTNCLQWRRSNNIDKVLEEPPAKWEYYKKLVSCKNHGFDKQGRPVYVERVGEIHYPTVFEYMTLDELMDIHVYQMELNARLCRESSEKLGKDVHQSVSIVDLQGMNMSHRHGLAFIKRCAKIDEAYYPETMGKLYIVNAPRLFGFFWNICKAWVHPNTQKKIQVLGSDYASELRQAIQAPFLVREYGGTCNCGMFDAGGKKKKASEKKEEIYCVPLCDLAEMKENLKYHNNDYDSLGHEDLNVKAGTDATLILQGIDKETGSLFTWNFKTLAKNIEFEIICVPHDSGNWREMKITSKEKGEIMASEFSEKLLSTKKEPFTLLSSRKLDRHMGAFRSPIHCDLHFKFDNTYSWMTSKNIRHKLVATCLDC